MENKIEHNGSEYLVTIEHDYCMGAPWEEHDGHGPVSDWTTRAKLPGEMFLLGDGRGGLGTDRSCRYYDFQEACKIARRDGWGHMPWEIEVERFGPELPYRVGGGRVVAGPFTASDGSNVNRAISDIYRQYEASIGAGEYAARAARADFDRLRGWCNGEWYWCGVIVSARCDCCGEWRVIGSLSGIESDAGEYLDEVARELIDEHTAESRPHDV